MDTAFFIASKVLWFLLKAETWLLLCFAACAIVLWRKRNGSAPRKTALRLLCSGTALFIAVGSLPLGVLLLRPLETQFTPMPTLEDPAGIVILGGAEDANLTAATGLSHLNEAAERLVEGIALARVYPDALLIFSGGSAAVFGEKLSGSAVAGQLFKDAGIYRERILLEGASRNTAENAALTLALLSEDQRASGRPWALVTSAFHMPRAVGAFCAAGWHHVVPWPVDYRVDPDLRLRWDLAGGLEDLNLAIKEWIGLVAYRLSGRSLSVFPADCLQ